MKAATKVAIAGPKHSREAKNVRKKTEIVREQPPLLQKGVVLQRLFEIEEQFGGGGFGQIFKCNHKKDNVKMVVKVEPARGDLRRAKLEMTVMMMLRGKSHIPILYGCGKIKECPYIVMQLLGRNLSDLRRRQPERALTEGTVFRISLQVITGLRHLHDTGYVHRDIKPSNCCIGVGNAKRKVHLIDFGMVRRIRDMDCNIRPARKYAPFRGTVRYVSIEMHNRKEVGFGDDLVGWFYSMVELLNGTLPWSSLDKPNEIMKSKMNTPVKDLCDTHPKPFLTFAETVSKIKYEDMPKYELLQKLLKNCVNSSITETTPYDWELAPASSNARSKRMPVYEKSMMASVGTDMPASIQQFRPVRDQVSTKSKETEKKEEKRTPSQEKNERNVELPQILMVDKTQPSAENITGKV